VKLRMSENHYSRTKIGMTHEPWFTFYLFPFLYSIQDSMFWMSWRVLILDLFKAHPWVHGTLVIVLLGLLSSNGFQQFPSALTCHQLEYSAVRSAS